MNQISSRLVGHDLVDVFCVEPCLERESVMILKICSARIRVPLCVAHKPDRMLVSDESNVLCTGNCLHRDFLPLLRYLPDGRLFSDDPACVLRRAEFVSVSFRAEFVSVGLL